MKTKKIIVVIVVVCIIAVGAGVAGGLYLSSKNTEAANKKSNGDRLVGMFVTVAENDPPSEFLETDSEADSGDGGRLYARLIDRYYTDEETGTKIKRSEYVFDGVEGYGCYGFYVDEHEHGYVSDYVDDIFCDYNLVWGDELSLEATIYYSGESFYAAVNPVYQSEDGSVYLTSGDLAECLTTSSNMNSTCSDEITVYENGKLVTKTSVVTLNIESTDKIERIEISEMSETNECLLTNSYLPSALPEEYKPASGAEYLLVVTETVANDGEKYSKRMIVDKNENYFDTYETLENGFYKQKSTMVNW